MRGINNGGRRKVKVIVAGSRYRVNEQGQRKEYKDYETVKKILDNSPFEITEVVSGCAIGVDTMGERWAKENGIPVKPFRPTKQDWIKYPKTAALMRNTEMAKYGEALIAVRVDWSRGTSDMIKKMEDRGKPVHIENICGE